MAWKKIAYIQESKLGLLHARYLPLDHQVHLPSA